MKSKTKHLAEKSMSNIVVLYWAAKNGLTSSMDLVRTNGESLPLIVSSTFVQIFDANVQHTFIASFNSTTRIFFFFLLYLLYTYTIYTHMAQ